MGNSAKRSNLLSSEEEKQRRSTFFAKLRGLDPNQVNTGDATSQAHQGGDGALISKTPEVMPVVPSEPLSAKLADQQLRVERLIAILEKNNTEIIAYPLAESSASRVEVWQNVLTRHCLSKIAFSAESWFAPELKEAITKQGADVNEANKANKEPVAVFYTDRKSRKENSVLDAEAGFMHTTEGKVAFAEHEAGITSATAGIASTGSLLLVPTPDEPRSLSLVPPVHIAVLKKTDVVADFQEWIAANKEVVGRSHFVLISGPSKTADIEKRLVYGVHGPKKLVVLLCE